jgi:hypothetical protein
LIRCRCRRSQLQHRAGDPARPPDSGEDDVGVARLGGRSCVDVVIVQVANLFVS